MILESLGCGYYIVVPSGQADTGRVLALNDCGAQVWTLLNTERSIEELTEYLTDEYEVSEEQAQEDLKEFLAVMKEYIA